MDDIELPPLDDSWHSSIRRAVDEVRRAAVLADRERRKKPDRAVYRRGVMLAEHPNFGVVLCWTDDGRAWIESEENKELAKEMREWAKGGFGEYKHNAAADALDGGQHV